MKNGQTPQRVAAEAGVVDRLPEDVAGRLVMARHEDAGEDDDQDADHVPVRRDRVDQRRDPDVEDVDERRADHEPDEEIEDVVDVVRVAPEQVEERRRVDREAVADGADDPDQADQVEPPGEPAPRGAAELRRPVVEAARRRVGRGDLGHRERDEGREGADDDPAPGDRDRAAPLEREVVRRQAAREDRDDREADREVPERAHRAEELLGVTELVEDLLVLGQMGLARSGCFAAHTRPPSSFCPVPPARRA